MTAKRKTPSSTSKINNEPGASRVGDDPRKNFGYTPEDMDICCGRGKGFFSHPGNQLFQSLVRENIDHYSMAGSKTRKSHVVVSIVQELSGHGARFIKRDKDGQWYKLSHALAHEKTGHAIRDHLIQRRRQQGGTEGCTESILLKSKQVIKASIKKTKPAPRKRVLHEKMVKAADPLAALEVEIISASSCSDKDEILFDLEEDPLSEFGGTQSWPNNVEPIEPLSPPRKATFNPCFQHTRDTATEDLVAFIDDHEKIEDETFTKLPQRHGTCEQLGRHVILSMPIAVDVDEAPAQIFSCDQLVPDLLSSTAAHDRPSIISIIPEDWL